MSVKAITPEAMRLLHEGSITLSRIEASGVRVNTEYLAATTKKTEDTIKELREQIRVKDIEIQALKESRDMFQNENAELKKTVKSLQAKLKKVEG